MEIWVDATRHHSTTSPPAERQELLQLALDEVRRAVAVAARTRLGEERLEVLGDEHVQRAARGRARPAAGGRARQGLQRRPPGK